MAVDLIDLVKGHLTPDVIQNAATYVGESSGTTQKALVGIVPTLIGALMNKASTSEGAQQLVGLLDAGKYDGSALTSVSRLFGGGVVTQSTLNAGKGLLDSLFGAKMGDVSSLLARFSGARPESATSLLALAAPLVMHVLGQQRSSIGTGTASLASLLGAQRSSLAGLLPAGLVSALGWSGISEPVTSAASATARAAQEMEPAPAAVSRRAWVIPIIVLGVLLLGALVWLTAPGRTARKLSELQLPGGVRISVPEGSFNFSLANWLASTADTRIPRRFVFEDLNFETGSTRLTPESLATVDTVVIVLKAHPTVGVALEGYTDNTGNPVANRKLSLDRADAVKDLMMKGGIPESRITSAGYGQDRPIAPNDTEQGRARNRRLELVVVKR
jgi:outer membrane protein OmpA-like peptidoglycan-associated protein